MSPEFATPQTGQTLRNVRIIAAAMIVGVLVFSFVTVFLRETFRQSGVR